MASARLNRIRAGWARAAITLLIPALASAAGTPQPCVDKSCDSAVVRLILDLNGRQDKTVESVSANSAGRIVQLHLQYLGLDTLPPEVGRLSALTHLGLDRNDLASLPAEIGRLSSLASLYLDNNRLTALPDEIGDLDSLRWLIAFGNALASVPPAIGRLSALFFLQLDGNRLTSLPPEIGNLSALERLSVSQNGLAGLPEEIGRLSALRQLVLEDNRLTGLPAGILRLSPVDGLWIGGNRLCAIPDSLETWASGFSVDPDWRRTQTSNGMDACPVQSLGRAQRDRRTGPEGPWFLAPGSAARGDARWYGLRGNRIRKPFRK
jgi:hypothetical protein